MIQVSCRAILVFSRALDVEKSEAALAAARERLNAFAQAMLADGYEVEVEVPYLVAYPVAQSIAQKPLDKLP